MAAAKSGKSGPQAGGGEPEAFVPRRGRPTAAQVEAINRAILRAAAEHFVASGYEGAAMEVIAATAGISKGTLYSRYPTKAELLRAVVEDRIAAWSEATSQHNHLMSDVMEERLRYHARTFITAMNSEEMRGFASILGGGAVSVPLFARTVYDSGYRYAVSLLAREIVEGTRDDPQPARDPQRVAEMLMAMLQGWQHVESSVRTITDEQAVAFAENAVDLVMAARAAW